MFKLMMVGVLVVGACSMTGCSREERAEMIDQVAGKARKLNNGGANDEAVPDIVRRQRRAEKIRQNTKWTPENQAKYPLEYCQAQLTEITKYEEQLNVAKFKAEKMRATAEREAKEAEAAQGKFTRALDSMKTAYREAAAADKWPVTMNGFPLSKDKAQQMIVDADAKASEAQAKIAVCRQRATLVARRLTDIETERANLQTLRTKVQQTIAGLEAQRVNDGSKSIRDSLSAISDSITVFNTGTDVTVEDIVAEDPSSARQRRFDEIMAQ